MSNMLEFEIVNPKTGSVVKVLVDKSDVDFYKKWSEGLPEDLEKRISDPNTTISDRAWFVSVRQMLNM
jgi:hypothetical protein